MAGVQTKPMAPTEACTSKSVRGVSGARVIFREPHPDEHCHAAAQARPPVPRGARERPMRRERVRRCMPRRATLQWMEQASESWLRPLVVERARAPVSRTWSRERAPFARRPRSPTQFAVAAVVGGTPGTRRPLANRRHREPCRPSECSAHAFAVARRDQRAAVISTARVVRLAPRQDANVWNRGTCVAPLT